MRDSGCYIKMEVDAAEVILRAAKLYEAVIEEIQGVPALQEQAAVLKYDAPRLFFEHAFLVGDTEEVCRVAKKHPEVTPEEVSIITLLVEVGERMIRSGITQYHKDFDYVEWQRWRLEGIGAGVYTAPQFPLYTDILVTGHSQDRMRIGVQGNRHLDLGDTLKTELPTSQRIIRKEGEVKEVGELPASNAYRWKMGLELATLLLEEEVEALQRGSGPSKSGKVMDFLRGLFPFSSSPHTK